MTFNAGKTFFARAPPFRGSLQIAQDRGVVSGRKVGFINQEQINGLVSERPHAVANTLSLQGASRVSKKLNRKR